MEIIVKVVQVHWSIEISTLTYFRNYDCKKANDKCYTDSILNDRFVFAVNSH